MQVNINIDGDDLGDFVRRVVREELAGTEADTLLLAVEAAEYLRVTEGHIHTAHHRGSLQAADEETRKKGDKLRFRRSELDRYAAARRS